jgi:hypothetical protein
MSLFSRIQAASKVLLGREERSVPPPFLSFHQGMGMPPPFKPEESLKAYGDNVYLYRSVLSISTEIARTDFKLQTRNAKGETKPVLKHQALGTLARPQPTRSGSRC